ncbi:hypothetical protein OX88_27765, partial [Pseudomonas coronafaciens pv. porri]
SVQGDSETTLHATGHLYIQQPEDVLSHGRPLLDTFTLNGISTLTSFAYSKSLSRAAEGGKKGKKGKAHQKCRACRNCRACRA